MSTILRLSKPSFIPFFLILTSTRTLLLHLCSQQLVRSTNLDHPPLVHNKNSISVSDCIQPMGYHQESVLRELLPNNALHKLVRLGIHVTRCFV